MDAGPTYIFSTASLPGTDIIRPDAPEFRAAVNCLVDPAVLSTIQPVLPFSYILRNTSNKYIVVYSTRWTLTDSTGTVTSQDRTWWNLSTLRDGDAIAPGASRLVSPMFRLGVPGAGPTGAELSQKIERTLSTFASKQTVVTSLETVVFEDGLAVGADATNATAQAQAYLDAERQIVDSIQTAGHAELQQALGSFVAGARTYKMSNPPQYDESLALYRRTFASALLARMRPSDLDRLQQNVANKRNLDIFRQ